MKTKLALFRAYVLWITFWFAQMAQTASAQQTPLPGAGSNATPPVTGQTPTIPAGVVQTNDPVILLLQHNADRLSKRLDDMEKFSEKNMDATKSSSERTITIANNQILLCTLVVILAGLLVAYVAYKTREDFREVREATTKDVQKVVENADASIKKSDETLSSLHAGFETDKTAALQSLKAAADAHTKELNAKFDSLISEWEKKAASYRPAEELEKQFITDIKRAEAQFLPADSLKLYFVELLRKNAASWSPEFRDTLMEELVKLATETAKKSDANNRSVAEHA